MIPESISLTELWRRGFLVAEDGTLLKASQFLTIRPRGDGTADAFTEGRSRRVIRWPFVIGQDADEPP
ncbi:hypothetical protein [Methylococcus mesophilus]|uniref:hypothetical protein n=1 Tax=Methylococcus mesophilus TaxID=2993564 RepID=UPI00224B8C5B|nr:hypothetical protein [Methylococcus mesophilus]UZR27871.1 hypothetical protein OOT43_14240 [Methylococcus mesophilus]